MAALPSPRARAPGPRPVRPAADAPTRPRPGQYVEAVGRILRVQSGAEELVAGAVARRPRLRARPRRAGAARRRVGRRRRRRRPRWPPRIARAAGADERERRFIEVATARVTRARRRRRPRPCSPTSRPTPRTRSRSAWPCRRSRSAARPRSRPRPGRWSKGSSRSTAATGGTAGMLAFVRQEQGRYDEAGELAARRWPSSRRPGTRCTPRRTCTTRPAITGPGWPGWTGGSRSCGAQASHRAHFSWHAALHELALGDDRAVPRALRRPARAAGRARRARARRLGVAAVARLHRRARGVPSSSARCWPPCRPGCWPTRRRRSWRMHAAVALAAAGDCRGLAALRRSAAARERTDVHRHASRRWPTR